VRHIEAGMAGHVPAMPGMTVERFVLVFLMDTVAWR
jgi:hypothetical protein